MSKQVVYAVDGRLTPAGRRAAEDRLTRALVDALKQARADGLTDEQIRAVVRG